MVFSKQAARIRFLNASATVLVTGVTLGSAGQLAQGATVTYAGHQQVADQWRTTKLAKPLDGDGDNVYGSAGYSMFGAGPSGTSLTSNPSYVSSISAAGSIPVQSGYFKMDDPTQAPDSNGDIPNIGTGAAYTSVNAETGQGVMASFTIGSNIVGTVPTFNVTLLNDNVDGTQYDFSAVGIRGGSGDSTLQTVVPTENDLVPDAYVFTISGAQAGDTFDIYAQRGGTSLVTVGIVAFDNVVATPEPASLGLLGMLGAMLLRQRKPVVQ